MWSVLQQSSKSHQHENGTGLHKTQGTATNMGAEKVKCKNKTC